MPLGPPVAHHPPPSRQELVGPSINGEAPINRSTGLQARQPSCRNIRLLQWRNKKFLQIKPEHHIRSEKTRDYFESCSKWEKERVHYLVPKLTKMFFFHIRRLGILTKDAPLPNCVLCARFVRRCTLIRGGNVCNARNLRLLQPFRPTTSTTNTTTNTNTNTTIPYTKQMPGAMPCTLYSSGNNVQLHWRCADVHWSKRGWSLLVRFHLSSDQRWVLLIDWGASEG